MIDEAGVKNQQIKLAYRTAFATPAGKIVLRHLISQACVTPTHTPDPNLLQWREGRRSIVLQIARTAMGPKKLTEVIIHQTTEPKE